MLLRDVRPKAGRAAVKHAELFNGVFCHDAAIAAQLPRGKAYPFEYGGTWIHPQVSRAWEVDFSKI